ncbi:hypothetical protein DFH09DRAFT_1318845 [Mycena vulgaris]|nr:hypothetical protein DFH09DRAFT_1318845 [Mycena vulgaris]
MSINTARSVLCQGSTHFLHLASHAVTLTIQDINRDHCRLATSVPVETHSPHTADGGDGAGSSNRGSNSNAANTSVPTHLAEGHGTLTNLPRSDSPTPFTDDDAEMEMRELGKGDFSEDEKTLAGTANSSRWKRCSLLPTMRSDLNTAEVSKKRCIEEASIQALKSGKHVNVKVSPMYIFLLRDGTVISLHATPDLELTQPIMRRLQQCDTGLRTSADRSLLVQSLLNLLVDKALEVRAIPFPSHPLFTVLKMLALSTGLSGIAPRGG